MPRSGRRCSRGRPRSHWIIVSSTRVRLWRVYDVVVDGVSPVNNYRGQFSKILRNGSYAELIEQLRKKSDKN